MKKTMRVAVSLVLVLVLSLALTACGAAKPYDSVLTNLKKAMTEDPTVMMEMLPPEFMKMMEMQGMTKEDIKEQMGAQDVSAVKDVKFEVKSETKMTEEQIKESDEMRNMLAALAGIEVKPITEGYIIELYSTYTENGQAKEETKEMGVVCIDGKWYLDMASSGMM